MKINIKRLAILFVVLFLALGLGKQCDAQQKNDFWGDVDKIYIKLRDFQFKVKNRIKIYEFKKGLDELRVLENGLQDDWGEDIKKDVWDLYKKIEEFEKKGKKYTESPKEEELKDRDLVTLKITTIIYRYNNIDTLLGSIQLKEEIAEMKGVEADTEEYENVIAEKINEIDTNIRELKDVIRKYYKK